jgi:hypothetical protein
MVEPFSTVAVATAGREGIRQAAERAAEAAEKLSPTLETASPEARSAIQSQLELFSDRGRPPTHIERTAVTEVHDSVSDATIDGKRQGLVGELVREKVARRAERSGMITNIEREPQFGDRRLDLRYQAARDIHVRDQLSGRMEDIGVDQWIAEEVKNRNVASLARDARGRLRDQLTSALRDDHHVILTVRKEVLNSPDGRAVLENLAKSLSPIMEESGKSLFIKGRDLGYAVARTVPTRGV